MRNQTKQNSGGSNIGANSGRQASRRRKLRLAAAVVPLAGMMMSQSAWAANTEQDVNNGSTDLTNAASYTPSGVPTVASDVTFNAATYTPAAFTLNSSKTFGSLNDLSSTALTISNAGGAADTLTLGGSGDNGDTVSGSASADLLFVNTGSTLTLTGGSGVTALGLVLGQSGNFDVAGTATISSIISGGFNVTKSGGGTLTLSGINTYSGGTTVSAGILQLTQTTGAAATGAFSLGGGTLQINSASTNFGYAPAITLTAASTLSNIGQAINDTGTINGGGFALNVNSGANRVYLNGAVTNVSQFNVTAGGMGFDLGSGNQGGGAPVVVSNGASLYIFEGATHAASNNITLNGGTGLSGNGALFEEASTGTATLSGTVTLNSTSSIGVNSNTNTLVLSGSVTGSGGLTKIGAGTLSLAGAGSNSYTGLTTVTGNSAATGLILAKTGGAIAVAGNLTIGDGTTGSASVFLTGSNEIASSSTLTFTGVNGKYGYLQLQGNSQTIGNVVETTTGFSVIEDKEAQTGAFGTGTITFNVASGTQSYGGYFRDNSTGLDATNSLALVKTGAGILQFGATSNGTGSAGTAAAAHNYSGGTSIQNGTLQLTASGSATPLSTVGTGNVTLDGGATFAGILDLNSLSVGITGLNGAAGTVLGQVLNNGSGTATLTVGNNNNPGSFAGILENNNNAGSGVLALTKTGSGAQTLSGANTYTGGTTINGGTLQFSGAGALPSASAITMGGGTLQIANDGAGSSGTISLGNAITSNGAITATIAVGNNGGASTGNTVAFGALNNGTAAQANATTFTFTGANGYLESFSSLALAGAGGNNNTLNPTSTSVTIVGAVTNQETTTGATHFDTLFLDGTTSGNAINGSISDSSVYTAVNAGDTRITKQNSSTWTLAGASTYHGPTAITAGTLNLTGSLANTQSVTTSSTGIFTESAAGVIGGAATFTQSSSGTSTLSGANTYTGLTTVSAGTLDVTGSGTLGSNAPLTVSGGTLDLGTTSQTVAAVNLTGASTIQNGSLTGTSYAASNASGTVAITANLLGAGALTKSGAGVLALSGSNSYAGGTTVSAGTLEFVNTGAQPASGTTTVAAGATLALGVGGTGQFTAANVGQYLANTLPRVNTVSRSLGIDTASGDLNLGGLTLPTNSAVSINKLGANALNLGAITRNAGSTVDLTLTTGTLTTTTANTGTSILGGYATFGGSTWAVSAGDGTNAGAISGLASGSYTASVAGTTAPGSTANVDFQASNTTAYTGQTINSLRFNTAAGTTLTLSGTNIITTGGILNTSTVGNNGSAITGGTLEGSSGGELIVINNDTQNTVTINSTIANNGAPTGLTKSGAGSLALGAVSSYSGATVVNAGSLVLNSSAGMPNTSSVVLGSGTTLSLARNVSQSTLFGTAVISGAGGVIENINNPNQSPVLDRANTYTGPTQFNIRGGFTAGVASTYDVNGNQTSGAFGVNSAIQMTGGGPIIDLNGLNTQVGSLSGSSGNIYLGRAVGGSAGILTTGGDNTSASFGVTISDTYVGNNSAGSGAVTIGGQIVKIGTGTQTFTANNLYAGATTVNGGTLAISTIANGGAQTTGSTSGASTTLTVASTSGIVVGETVLGAGIQNSSTTVTAVNTGSVTLSAAVTVPAGSAISFGNGNGIGTSSNVASNLVLNNGTLQYTGVAANTDRLFTVGSTVAAATGTLNASGTGALNFTNTGAIAYGTSNQTRTLALTGTNTGNNTLASSIGDNGAGAVSLSKAGAGTWIVTHANSYSGGTTISAGKLQAVGTGLGTGSVSVAGGTIAVNDGVTTTAQALTTGDQTWKASSGYTARVFNDGTADKMTLTAQTGTLTFDSTISTSNPFTVTAAAAAASLTTSTSQDWVIAGGITTLSGLGTGNLASYAVPTVGNPTVLATAGAAPGSSAFVLTMPSSLFSSGYSSAAPALELEALGGGGYTLDVVYSAAPEPGTAMLVLAGGLPMLLNRRRRNGAASR